jgi:hypothetical protein
MSTPPSGLQRRKRPYWQIHHRHRELQNIYFHPVNRLHQTSNIFNARLPAIPLPGPAPHDLSKNVQHAKVILARIIKNRSEAWPI